MEKNNYKCWENGLINIFTDFYLTHTPLEVNYIIFTQALTSPKSPSREHFSSFLSVAKAESPVTCLHTSTWPQQRQQQPSPALWHSRAPGALRAGSKEARAGRPSCKLGGFLQWTLTQLHLCLDSSTMCIKTTRNKSKLSWIFEKDAFPQPSVSWRSGPDDTQEFK